MKLTLSTVLTATPTIESVDS